MRSSRALVCCAARICAQPLLKLYCIVSHFRFTYLLIYLLTTMEFKTESVYPVPKTGNAANQY